MMNAGGLRGSSTSSSESDGNGSASGEGGKKHRKRKRRERRSGKGQEQNENGMPTAQELSEQRQRMAHDLECLRQGRPIEDPQHKIKSVHIPVKIEGIVVGAMVDSGATVSVISERVAKLLEDLGRARRKPKNMVCELFGDGTQNVSFNECMEVDIQILGRPAPVDAMIMTTGWCDVLVGHDVLNATMVCIDYEKKTVHGGTHSNHSVPFSRRIDMLRALLSMDECCKEVERLKRLRG
jgi:hypothetical protein